MYEERDGFPHEIGAFLGYPVNDVRGFIQNEGKGCLMTGYWKVYENLAGAKMIFNKYDRAKDSAVNEFLTGKLSGRLQCKKNGGFRRRKWRKQ